MAVRPRIAVTGPDRGGLVPWLMSATALYLAGGRPLRVTPRRLTAAGSFDGVLLGGGSDIDPHRYGADRDVAPSRRLERHRSRLVRLRRWLTAPAWLLALLLKKTLSIGALEIDPPRDHMELELLEKARAENLPVLGICRGCQLVNVFFGGDLHQDLRGYDLNPSKVDSVFPKKRIRIEGPSRLGELVGTGDCRVNSLHNQAVRNLGSGLAITARDGDGIVQGIEHQGLDFFLGVQWHPEYLPQKRRQRRLFRGLVTAAGKGRSQSEGNVHRDD